MTDDYHFTLATLHGLRMRQVATGSARWYVVDDTVSTGGVHNPVMQAQKDKTGHFYHDTPEELVDTYCRVHELGKYAHG